MAYRWEGKTFIRDVWSPDHPGEYVAPAAALEETRRWYAFDRQDQPGRDVPDWADAVERKVEGDVEVFVLRDRAKDYCVEVRLRGSEVQVQAIPPAVAYQYALDADEEKRSRGKTVVNERHPRGAP